MRPLAFLAVLSVAVVAAWFALVSAGTSVTSDDGAYAVQAIQVTDGDGWSVPHALADVDPDGRTYPFVNSTITEDGFFPGGRSAVWVELLASTHGALGLVGFRSLPAIGLAMAAVAAAHVSGRIHGPSARLPAGLLVLASPVLFDALQLWAHAPVVGAIAVLLACAVGPASSSVRWSKVLVGSAAASLASALRPDGLIFALAVVAVCGVVALRARSVGRIAAAGAFGAAAMAGYAASALYARSVVGSAEAVGATSIRSEASGVAGFVGSRVSGALHTFVSAWGDPVGVVVAVLAVAVVGAAVAGVRRGDTREATVLVGVACAIWIVRISVMPDAPASGLLGAWPIVLLVLVRRWRDLAEQERQLAAIIGVASFGVLVTQYSIGGGLNWGGRFVAPAIPALAVLVVGALQSLPRGQGEAALRRSVVALAAVLVIGSLAFDATYRARHREMVDAAQSLDGRIVVTSIDALPRLAWRLHPGVQWLVLPPDPDEEEPAGTLLELLQRQGIERVQLLGVLGADADILSGGVVKETVGLDAVPIAVPPG